MFVCYLFLSDLVLLHKRKSNKQKSNTSKLIPPNNFPTYFTRSSFATLEAECECLVDLQAFSSRSLRLVRCSRADEFVTPAYVPFLPASLPFLGRLHCPVFCLLLRLDAHGGSLVLDPVFTVCKKVFWLYFLLWTEENFWLSLACLSLSQPVCHNVNREIIALITRWIQSPMWCMPFF